MSHLNFKVKISELQLSHFRLALLDKKDRLCLGLFSSVIILLCVDTYTQTHTHTHSILV